MPIFQPASSVLHVLHILETGKVAASRILSCCVRNAQKAQDARDALVSAAGNRHALLDAAGIIAWFATITTVVDFSGHYNSKVIVILDRIASILRAGRKLRGFFKDPFETMGLCKE